MSVFKTSGVLIIRSLNAEKCDQKYHTSAFNHILAVSFLTSAIYFELLKIRAPVGKLVGVPLSLIPIPYLPGRENPRCHSNILCWPQI